jgi:hypothetical protein
MANEVSFSNAKLPAVADLAKALRTVADDVGGSGSIILKMDKTGHWVFGADQTEVEDDSTWAVNPFSFVHGYIAWGEGEVLAEKMAPVTQPLPELDAAPPGAKRGWEVQVGCSLKCLDGEDKGMEARYTVTSVGGKKAVQKLALDIAAQVDKDQSKPVPVVVLKKEHYLHKSYGRIYTPVFDIKSWIGMEGPAAEPAAEVPSPAAAETPAEEPQRRRRRSV